eukprot:996850-Prorocentrum_minimum.AAC.1
MTTSPPIPCKGFPSLSEPRECLQRNLYLARVLATCGCWSARRADGRADGFDELTQGAYPSLTMETMVTM